MANDSLVAKVFGAIPPKGSDRYKVLIQPISTELNWTIQAWLNSWPTETVTNEYQSLADGVFKTINKALVQTKEAANLIGEQGAMDIGALTTTGAAILAKVKGVIDKLPSGIMAPELTRKLWMGSSGFTMGLDLRFVAEKDALEEVEKPVRVLQALQYPTQSQPTQALGKLNVFFDKPPLVRVQIASRLTIEEAAITRCSVNLSTALDENGWSLGATVGLSIVANEWWDRDTFLKAVNFPKLTSDEVIKSDKTVMKQERNI